MLLLGYTSFFTLGMILVLLGVNQAEMARDLSLDLAASGLLGALLALGLGVGVACTGPLVDRLRARLLFVTASLLTSVALLTVTPSMSFARTALHVVLIGAGCGGYDTVLNVMILKRSEARASSALAALHACATAGAALGPFAIAWLSRTHWTASFHRLGAIYLGFAIWGACTRFPDRRASGETASLASLSSPVLFGLALVAFAYVGIENGLTMLAVPWATFAGAGEAVGRSAIGAFWFGLFAGRVLLALQARTFGAGLLAGCGIIGAIIVGAAAALSLSPFWVLAATGLAIGPVYPVMIALSARRFPRAIGTASGLAAGAGALGGFAWPWLAGALGDAFSLRSAIALLAGCSLLIAIAALGLARAGSPPSAAALRHPT